MKVDRHEMSFVIMIKAKSKSVYVKFVTETEMIEWIALIDKRSKLFLGHAPEPIFKSQNDLKTAIAKHNTIDEAHPSTTTLLPEHPGSAVAM